MVTENSMELENQAFLSNQDITGEAPKLLLCSSIASSSDLGSNEGITPMAGIGKEYPELSWYYLYLSNKELKRYISVFSGRKAVRLRTPSGTVEERFFCFKVFSYTATDHRKRFEQCAYTKEEYTARRDSARVVKEAFATGSTQKLNTLLFLQILLQRPVHQLDIVRHGFIQIDKFLHLTLRNYCRTVCVIVRHQILAGKHGRQNTFQLPQGGTYKQPTVAFGGLSSEKATNPYYRWCLSGERGMYHAFAPQYKAGIRFWQYDGGSELSSCVSV